jgi:predicted nucleotidyltransferase
MDRETAIEAERFAKRAKKSMSIEKIILFGSRARGDNFITSDFDFVVVSDDFQGISSAKRYSRLLELWSSPNDMEALCYTSEEWNSIRNKRGILLNAQKEGIIIK